MSPGVSLTWDHSRLVDLPLPPCGMWKYFSDLDIDKAQAIVEIMGYDSTERPIIEVYVRFKGPWGYPDDTERMLRALDTPRFWELKNQGRLKPLN